MKIYPERLPLSVRNDPKRSAECKVYDALSKLPDGYIVFYSVAWQVRDSKKGRGMVKQILSSFIQILG